MKIGLFGTSANPPGEHHREIVREASRHFDKVIVVPCGPRTDGKLTVNDIAPIHRAIMSDLAFRGIAPNVEVDLSDLERSEFTKTYHLEERYRHLGEVWHIVGADLVVGGASGGADIQSWQYGQRLWNHSRFAVILRAHVNFSINDLPPQHILIRPERSGSSTEIRRNVFEHRPITGLVSPDIEEYIDRFSLYREEKNKDRITTHISEPRILFHVNEYSEEAKRLYEEVREREDTKDPNLIVSIGGDGTMIRAIREHWRKRLPFLGINAGHEGFLLNKRVGHLTPDFFKQKFVLRNSPMLHIKAQGPTDRVEEILAVNDTWIQAEPGKLGWFDIYVNGRKKFFGQTVMSDAILVATAAGSSAYAQYMGATPIHFSEEKLLLVGSNVNKPRSWRQGTHLFLDRTEVRIKNADPSGWRKTCGFADNAALGEIVETTVRKSNIASVHLLFTPQSDREKLDKYRFPRS